MSLFDFFGKDRDSKSPRNAKDRDSKSPRNAKEFFDKDGFSVNPETAEQPQQQAGSPFSVYYPKSFSDIAVIISEMKKGKAAVVHLNDLKPETAIRIIDMLSGAVYALGGGVHEMEKNIFLFSASSVEMH